MLLTRTALSPGELLPLTGPKGMRLTYDNHKGQELDRDLPNEAEAPTNGVKSGGGGFGLNGKCAVGAVPENAGAEAFGGAPMPGN